MMIVTIHIPAFMINIHPGPPNAYFNIGNKNITVNATIQFTSVPYGNMLGFAISAI